MIHRRPAALLILLMIPLGLVAETTWTKHIVQPASGAKGSINTAVAADFNGDGHLDIIASFNGGVTVFPGPTWEPPFVCHVFASKRPGTSPRGGCIHSCLMDVDGDGDLDFCGSNKTVFWLECPEKPFEQPWIYRNIDDIIKGTHCLITGDVNSDGRLDLIANSFAKADATPVPNSITWLEIPAEPHSATNWTRHVFADQDAPGGNHYMGFGDVNGDGRPDIACGAKGGPNFEGGEWFAWWEQPATGAKGPWKKHLLSDKEPGATNIIPVDLNADGKTDYAASRGHGFGVLWYQGPDFKQIEIDPTIERPHCFDVADIDGDGDPDLATCGSLKTGTAAWYENDGKATFTRHDIDTNQSSYDLRLVDLDQDGDLDILIAGHFSRNIVWYENPTK